MHRFIWFGVLVFLLSPMIAWSHEPSAIVPGSRIRITEQGKSEPRSGTVVRAETDTVVLGLDSSVRRTSIPWEAISRLEVSQGRKSHIAAGVGIGFLVGAGIGAVFGAAFAPDGGSDGSTTDVSAAMGAGVGAGIGMLLGAGIGATVKSEKWEEVPSGRWQVNFWPAGPGSFALALSVGL